jgi:hypothetical protein
VGEIVTIQGKITDALQFWEPARLVYNLVLAATVAAVLREGVLTLPLEAWAGFVILAMLANIAYCAAYVPDIFVQSSDFAPLWRQAGRAALWFLGTFCAVILAFVIAWSERPHVPVP